MTNLDSIFKSRDITLPTKVRLVKAMVFPVVMYGCESWIVKKAECRRIDAFELWCWRRLLRVPWTARRSNQSTLKEINPGISLEGMMLTLKLQYFGHLMRRIDSLEKTLMLGRIGGRRRRGRQRMRWLDGITDYGRESEWTPGVGDGQGGLACRDSRGRKELDTTERLNWTVKRGSVVHPPIPPSGDILCSYSSASKPRNWHWYYVSMYTVVPCHLSLGSDWCNHHTIRASRVAVVKNLPANARDMGLILGWEIPWKRKWQPAPVFLPEIP